METRPRWVSITIYVTPGAWALRGDFLEGMASSGRHPARTSPNQCWRPGRTGATAVTERSLWFSLRHLQVAQHPLQDFLVGVMVLPSAEVTDVALDAQAASPGFVCVQHGVIDPDREQNGRLARPLLIQGPRHFLLNPITGNRVFGQDQQHLVAQPDRLVDGVDDLGADRHVVRREPAAHAFVLEIGVEAVGELLVLARIADEAGEELDRLVQQRGQVVDQVIRQADTAQEGEGQWTRALQGSMVDGAWSSMLAGFQALCPHQIGISEYRLP